MIQIQVPLFTRSGACEQRLQSLLCNEHFRGPKGPPTATSSISAWGLLLNLGKQILPCRRQSRHARELNIPQKHPTPKLRAELFVLAKRWKQPQCPKAPNGEIRCGIYIQWNVNQPSQRMNSNRCYNTNARSTRRYWNFTSNSILCLKGINPTKVRETPQIAGRISRTNRWPIHLLIWGNRGLWVDCALLSLALTCHLSNNKDIFLSF